MNTESAPNQSISPTLIPQGQRLTFILCFVGVTILGIALSILPGEIAYNLLSSAYPSNVVQSTLPDPLGLLDILRESSGAQPIEGWAIWFGLLHSVVINTIIGVFIGVLQWSILRQYLPSKLNWILATILGYQLAGLLSANSPAIFYALTCQGLFQWLAIRPLVRNSWIWLLIELTAFLLANMFGSLLFQIGLKVTNGWLLHSLLLGLIQSAFFCLSPLRSSRTGQG